MVPASFGCGVSVFAAIATLAPSCAALSAMASPMPRDAPVMNRVFCLSVAIGFLRGCGGSDGERRIRPIDALGAVDHRPLEPRAGDREILGEEPGRGNEIGRANV